MVHVTVICTENLLTINMHSHQYMMIITFKMKNSTYCYIEFEDCGCCLFDYFCLELSIVSLFKALNGDSGKRITSKYDLCKCLFRKL